MAVSGKFQQVNFAMLKNHRVYMMVTFLEEAIGGVESLVMRTAKTMAAQGEDISIITCYFADTAQRVPGLDLKISGWSYNLQNTCISWIYRTQYFCTLQGLLWFFCLL